MAKPAARRIPSDDCIVTVDGQEYDPHVGEWIEATKKVSPSDIRLMTELGTLGVKLQALEGEEGASDHQLAMMDESLVTALDVIADRIADWNWTDEHGNPYPRPSTERAAFRAALPRLSMDEVYYLISAIQGDTPGEQKNGSRPSLTSTSGTPRRRSRA